MIRFKISTRQCGENAQDQKQGQDLEAIRGNCSWTVT